MREKNYKIILKSFGKASLFIAIGMVIGLFVAFVHALLKHFIGDNDLVNFIVYLCVLWIVMGVLHSIIEFRHRKNVEKLEKDFEESSFKSAKAFSIELKKYYQQSDKAIEDALTSIYGENITKRVMEEKANEEIH